MVREGRRRCGSGCRLLHLEKRMLYIVSTNSQCGKRNENRHQG